MRAPTLLALCLLASPAAAAPLVAALTPGAETDQVRGILLKPYGQASGTPVQAPAWNGDLDSLQKMLTAHAADLLLLHGPALSTLCQAQAVDKLDWQRLGRSRFLDGASSDCGAGAFITTTVLAWDRDKMQGAPRWADFWDVARHPGRRGLPRRARGTLEIALLADGVAPADIVKTLRTKQGIDRAFRKLDQLKPYILWWDTPDQPAQWLESGKVLMSAAPAQTLCAPRLDADAKAADRHGGHHAPPRHIGVQWQDGLVEITSWAIPHDGAHAAATDAARIALTIATDPIRMADFAHATCLGPATQGALALLPAAAQADSASLPAHLAAGLPIDASFWADNGPRLETRFAAWLGQ